MSLIASGKATSTATYTTTQAYSTLYAIASDGMVGGYTNTVVNVTANDGTVTKVFSDNNRRPNDGIYHGCSLAIYEISGIASGKTVTFSPITSGYAVIIWAILG